MTKALARMSLDEAVDAFALHVIQQHAEVESGNVPKGNRHAKRYIAIWDHLRATWADAGRDALSRLLNHENVHVRIMAAALLLQFRTRAAQKVLRTESQRADLAGFAAQQALKRWEEGSWELDK